MLGKSMSFYRSGDKGWRYGLNANDFGAPSQSNLDSLFASGTLLLEGEKVPCAPAKLRLVAPREAELTLTEGRFHQVRRMFAAGGATVLTLHRERFGPLELGDLAAGQWRELPVGFFKP